MGKIERIISKHSHIEGTLTATFFFVLSLLTLLLPIIQIGSIMVSHPILAIVEKAIANSGITNKCHAELVWVCSVIFVISLTVAAIFYFKQLHASDRFAFREILLFLFLQFFLLQTPFFIFEVGTLYNCETDGQTLLAIFISSPKVSLMTIIWGVIFDIVNRLREKKHCP